jgi:hypothetical protein
MSAVDAQFAQRRRFAAGEDLNPVGTDPTPATWPVGELIAVDGHASWTVDHEDGQPLPGGACALLDAEVTV